MKCLAHVCFANDWLSFMTACGDEAKGFLRVQLDVLSSMRPTNALHGNVLCYLFDGTYALRQICHMCIRKGF